MTTPTPPPGSELDALLVQLPRSLPPSRDLWPGIAAEIAPRHVVRRWPAAIAASLAVACVGGYMAWRITPPAPVADASRAGHADPAMRDVVDRDAEYRATRAALVVTYEERLKMLSPVTRARIAADLATIQRARQDLREALSADPGSRVLLRLYESTTQQEFDLYTTVGRNTEPAASRTRT
jgi:hypothetical protein